MRFQRRSAYEVYCLQQSEPSPKYNTAGSSSAPVVLVRRRARWGTSKAKAAPPPLFKPREGEQQKYAPRFIGMQSADKILSFCRDRPPPPHHCMHIDTQRLRWPATSGTASSLPTSKVRCGSVMVPSAPSGEYTRKSEAGRRAAAGAQRQNGFWSSSKHHHHHRFLVKFVASIAPPVTRSRAPAPSNHRPIDWAAAKPRAFLPLPPAF